MSIAKLPLKLAKEPLVDVVFEVRFNATAPVSELLPSMIFSAMAGKGLGKIEPLPAAQIPLSIRQSEPNLQYSALLRIVWGNYFIAIGDNVLAVASQMPYKGWNDFLAAILTTFNILESAKVVTTIERCAIKYTDMFDTKDDHAFAMKQMNVSIRIGSEPNPIGLTTIRTDIQRGNYSHTVQIATSASMSILTAAPKTGSILDIDSSILKVQRDPAVFFQKLPEIADDLHSENKKLFFELLSVDGLNNAGPIYE